MILMEKPEGKLSLERSRRKWVDNIKMDLRWNVVVWTGLMWLRIVSTVGLL
jgi:hypothetical protein